MAGKSSGRRLILGFAALALAVWTLVVGGALVWNLQNAEQQVMDMAYAEARTNLDKDMRFRRWASDHGGVYVPISERQRSVRWLEHVPERDVTLDDGRRLTLLNPASVMRQVMNSYPANNGVRGRITGLKYLNPDNAPDVWETHQIEAFAAGKAREAVAVADIDGKPYLRYLRATFMEPGCEKCHAVLGYKLGDLRGATGVNLPLAAYYEQIDRSRRNMAFSYGTIWLLGFAGIGGSARAALGHDRRRRLDEEQLRIAAAAFELHEAMMVTDANNVILRVNQAFTEITGYSAAEAVGQTPRLLRSGRHDAKFYQAMRETLARTGVWRGEVWDRRKNGEEYPKWMTISAVKDEVGTVTHYVAAHYEITERKKAEEKINELAFFDQLTGLPNRTLLLDRLKQAMTASARTGSHAALLFLDLDHFKNLNDTLGHDMGDLLLQQVAQRLTACVRAGDTVARLGGDEFVIMLAGLSSHQPDAATQAEAVGEKILTALNKAFRLRDVAYHTTPSIGCTLFVGLKTEVDALLKQADLAMYKAKEAGRNSLRFFDRDMEVVVVRRAALESDLHVAVEEQQFLLHYQAQVAGGRVVGGEALLRWRHPQRGMVSPADFIPVAEETGLILPLGNWVMVTACNQLVAWAQQPGMEHLTLAVNVSAVQFRQPDFVDQVLVVLRNTGANPQRLKLELTESLLVANVDDVIEKMFALKARGVGFSLDDFGTGYSSLSYLKRLPLDQLKIDRSFVRDVLSDSNDAAIARTIIALSQSLGLSVIAEGVETELQRDFLADSGCHAYQGYFFSRPLPVDDFEEFARSAA